MDDVGKIIEEMSAKRDAQARQEMLDRIEAARRLPGWTEVNLWAGFLDYATVYEHDLCAALVQPTKEAQQRHERKCKP